MSVFSNRSSNRKSDDTMDDDTDDKDDTKRKSRNLSEKKRRDQFNLLINELSSIVSTNGRKMDKSTVLKSTISFLKNHNEVLVRSRTHDIQEDWKPSFLTNEQFTHLFLEAIDGFIISFLTTGRILYVSENVSSLLGYLPSTLMNSTIYDITHESNHSNLYNILSASRLEPCGKERELSFRCHMKRSSFKSDSDSVYETVHLVGCIKYDLDDPRSSGKLMNTTHNVLQESRLIFVGTCRLESPQIIREVLIMDSSRSEFTSRHSLEWKFLFLDHRAPPIIGYLPFEVLGTSGYDYYHVDDLDKVIKCHEALMQKGEGTSCFYRFLTKGQQWIWLQTRFYITYHQWNSKPEFIVCTHKVVSYLNLLKRESECEHLEESSRRSKSPSGVSLWLTKNSGSRSCKQVNLGTESNSADSSVSRQSQLTSSTLRQRYETVPVECGVGSSPVHVESSTNCYPSQQSSHQEVNQLERKHEELQQLIEEQQAELRRLSEQLVMARYGILPSIINVTMPYSVLPAMPSAELFVSSTPLQEQQEVSGNRVGSNQESCFPDGAAGSAECAILPVCLPPSERHDH